jgi:uncharacterized protein (TIGR00369 family)
MDDLIVRNDPQNRCFGCSPHNERGLKLRFLRTGEGAVETRYTAPEHLCGAPGVIHGGVQATLLDEVMGVSAHAGCDDEDLDVVTVDLHVRYLRPAPTGRPLVVRGRLLRREADDFFVEAEIVGEDGTILTSARARWHRIQIR